MQKAVMTVRTLPKSEWQSYFDHVSKGLIGERAMVEVVGLAFGDRTEARCLPLIGITYDSKDDVLQIALDGLDHLIHRPRDIAVSDDSEGERMEITDANRQKQIVRLVKPMRYPRRTTRVS